MSSRLLVPRSPHQNISFRRRVLQSVRNDPGLAEDYWNICAGSIEFFVNAFVWTYNPKKEECPKIPFVTWPFQDEAFAVMEDCIGREDLLFEKSREMGASWMIALVFLHRWMFRYMQSFLMVSRKEKLVDDSTNPDSLFWKLDFVISNLPPWLRPRLRRTAMHLYNEDTGSTIDGESTTGDIGRGGRRTAILLDEFAAFERDDGYRALSSTRDNTNCRFFNSTPQGSANAFYDKAHDGTTRKVRLHWSMHPEKARGLYTDASGKPRSPWYDRQCERAGHPTEIAQELDIDYLGSAFQWYDAGTLDRAKAEHCRPPYLVGSMGYDNAARPTGFVNQTDGWLKLWVHLFEGKPPKDRRYFIACDIATGTGASNSVIAIGDGLTREKIGEWACSNMLPHDMAKVAAALGWFFEGLGGPAVIIWEANGPGRIFGKTLMDLGYTAVFYRPKDEKSVVKKDSLVPGWYSTRELRSELLGEHRRAMAVREFIDRSAEAIDECREYVYQPDGWVVHSRAANSIDPTGARDNHGDRVIATALLWKLMKEFKPVQEEQAPRVPDNSFHARRERYLTEAKAKDRW